MLFIVSPPAKTNSETVLLDSRCEMKFSVFGKL